MGAVSMDTIERHPGDYPIYATYTTEQHPDYRVVIRYEDPHGSGPWEWDTWLSCYNGRSPKHQHSSVNVWNPERNQSLPEQSVVLGHYTSVHDLDDDELAEYMPTDGTIIGLDYSGGEYVRVSDSTDPREWDGYFHITEAHWLALMGPDSSEGWTYTSRERHLRRGLSGCCDDATAWITGEVFGWHLEKRERWTNDETGEHRYEWEYVEGCGGYYGQEEIPRMVEEAFGGVPSGPAIEVAA